MTGLSFESFHRLIHGFDPFPWQVRAAHRLAGREVFSVAVPTGLGKSAMVDAAVWAAAQGAWRRIAFVVDRRIVVDAVYQRAARIASVLANSDDPEIKALARELGQIQVVRLRGGVFGDDDWVLYPERLTIILSTVDQLGSRLLFRGYGVSPRRWPMHAGFVASDALVVVDEAHLSNPFLQTVSAVRGAGANVSLVPMSATLGDDQTEDALSLNDADLALALVQQRLHAVKEAQLVSCGSTESEFVRAAIEAVQSAFEKPEVRRVGLVVNRVASARQCFNKLQSAGVRAALLTGRVRPADRDAKLADLLPEVEAGRARNTEDSPLVVVATQTIEVGADLDFDALVTECAPLSALRQRFGRLDRLGQLGRSQAFILGREAKVRDDPVYGPVLADTWDWLTERAGSGFIDFGVEALDRMLAAHPAPVEPLQHAATLLPTHLQMLAQTGPFVPEFDLGPWLHGPTDRAPDVSLVWRDDLLVETPADWPMAVSMLPPMRREALSLPVGVTRRWLTGAKPGNQWGDQEGSADPGQTGDEEERPVLRWRGPDDCQVIPARQIRPGDTLVLPASYGGCDEWGWAPESSLPVPDVADACLGERVEAGASRRVVLRVTWGRWTTFGAAGVGLQHQVQELLALEADAVKAEEDLSEALDAAKQGLIGTVLGSSHPLAARLRDPRIEHHPLGFIVRGTGTEELEGVIETGRPVPLDVHHADVGRWAAGLTRGHPESARIVEAARIHDAGKAEPRMQALLHGNPMRAAAGPLLAKSALRRRTEQVAAYVASGMPRGFRHEFATLVYQKVDDPLVRILVATHHGYGRPWAISCEDPEAPGANVAHLDHHWAEEWFAQCNDHGPWALAAMEWLLRAADARASMEEAEAGGDR